MCAFICELNISMKSMDILSDTVNSAFRDSPTAQKFKVKRTKAKAIIKHVLGDTIFEEFVDWIRNSIHFENFPFLWMKQLMEQ